MLVKEKEIRVLRTYPILNSRGVQIGIEKLDEDYNIWYSYYPGIAHTIGILGMVKGSSTNGTIKVPRQVV